MFLDLKLMFKFSCQQVSIACQLRTQKICHLTVATHTAFQELLLALFNVREILEFEILSSEKHLCTEKSLNFICVQVFHPFFLLLTETPARMARLATNR